jgi:hypothetical protein
MRINHNISAMITQGSPVIDSGIGKPAENVYTAMFDQFFIVVDNDEDRLRGNGACFPRNMVAQPYSGEYDDVAPEAHVFIENSFTCGVHQRVNVPHGPAITATRPCYSIAALCISSGMCKRWATRGARSTARR